MLLAPSSLRKSLVFMALCSLRPGGRETGNSTFPLHKVAIQVTEGDGEDMEVKVDEENMDKVGAVPTPAVGTKGAVRLLHMKWMCLIPLALS